MKCLVIYDCYGLIDSDSNFNNYFSACQHAMLQTKENFAHDYIIFSRQKRIFLRLNLEYRGIK